MNVVEKVNLILKKANISKVNLSKYLGVSRQMVYNYFDGDDLSKLPNEKCQLLFNLLDVTSEKEILDISITNDYLQRVGSKIFDTKKSTPKKEESIDLAGLKKDEIIAKIREKRNVNQLKVAMDLKSYLQKIKIN